jgi:hypothetical protein
MIADSVHAKLMDRIDSGVPFRSSDLVVLAKDMGMRDHYAQTKVNSLTQAQRMAGRIVQVGGRRGKGYIWQLVATAPPPPVTDAPIPQPSAVIVQGPFDPDPAVEGKNPVLWRKRHWSL